MAETVIPFDAGWQQILREAGKSARRPTVQIRQSSDLALSADFVRHADIIECTRANLYLSEDGYRLGMRFHSDDGQENSWRLCKDGGSGLRRVKSNGRVLQISAHKLRAPVIPRLAKLPRPDRTFEPRRDVHGLWVIELRPCFELRYGKLRGEIGPEESGIYRYKMNNQIVYIGRGKLLERFGSSERQEWQFDYIEYSPLNNEDAERRWEAYWLERFRDAHNRWPVYNRVGGRSLEKGSSRFG